MTGRARTVWYVVCITPDRGYRALGVGMTYSHNGSNVEQCLHLRGYRIEAPSFIGDTLRAHALMLAMYTT